MTMERPTFWQWFDSRKAAAVASPIGQHMTQHGFDVMHTGGGCLTWSKRSPHRANWSIWIADEGVGLGDDLPDWQTSATFGASLIHDETGEDMEGPNGVTLAECLAWGETADSREAHPLDGMRVHYSGDNERPTLLTLGELIRNFDVSDGWHDHMSPENMREELDSRGWCTGLHDNGQYLVLNMECLKLCPTPELWDETTPRQKKPL